MSNIHKGQITVGNKTYQVEVIDGIRYVDGKTIDEFLTHSQ